MSAEESILESIRYELWLFDFAFLRKIRDGWRMSNGRLWAEVRLVSSSVGPEVKVVTESSGKPWKSVNAISRSRFSQVWLRQTINDRFAQLSR